MRKGSWLNLRYHLGNCLEVIRKSIKHFSHDEWYVGQELSPGLLEYKAGVVTSWL
jgi:hypothetical protein